MVDICLNYGMFRGENDGVDSVDRVYSSRKNTHRSRFRCAALDVAVKQSVARCFHLKIDKCSLRPSDPVALTLQNIRRPTTLDLGHVIEQLVCVGSRFEEPLFEIFFGHRVAATPAQSAASLFVRQRRLIVRAPVDLRQPLVRKAFLVHLQEKPLVKFVIFGPVGVHLPPPVIADAKPLQLPAHHVDICLGPLTRIYTTFYGRILGRLAKRIPTDRVHDVKPFEPLVPGHRIAGRIISHMPHVQIARRIRQHLELVKFWPLVAALGFGLKRTAIGPFLLPFLLDLFWKIFLVHLFHVKS